MKKLLLLFILMIVLFNINICVYAETKCIENDFCSCEEKHSFNEILVTLTHEESIKNIKYTTSFFQK